MKASLERGGCGWRVWGVDLQREPIIQSLPMGSMYSITSRKALRMTRNPEHYGASSFGINSQKGHVVHIAKQGDKGAEELG